MPFNGKAVLELRERESLTQSQLARLLEVCPSTISFWENYVKDPTVGHLDRLYSLADKRGHEDLIFYRSPIK